MMISLHVARCGCMFYSVLSNVLWNCWHMLDSAQVLAEVLVIFCTYDVHGYVLEFSLQVAMNSTSIEQTLKLPPQSI